MILCCYRRIEISKTCFKKTSRRVESDFVPFKFSHHHYYSSPPLLVFIVVESFYLSQNNKPEKVGARTRRTIFLYACQQRLQQTEQA